MREARPLTAQRPDDLAVPVLYAKAEVVMSNRKLLISPRILMVDDEIEQLELRAKVIGMCGFAAITANGPMEAIDIMTRRQRGTINLPFSTTTCLS